VAETTTVEPLSRGVDGTASTIAHMHKLVALGKLDPTIQKMATWIRLSVPQDYRGSTKQTLAAVFDFVRKHGIFQRDPFQIEKIEHPIEAMRPVIQARLAGKYKGPGLFIGDCDTLAGVFLASLAGVLGFHYAFETAKTDAQRPDEFSHVWDAFWVDGEWWPLDPSTPGTVPGWRPPVAPENFRRWQEEPIESTLKGIVPGLGDGHENPPVHGAYQRPDDRDYVPYEYYGYGITKGWEGDQVIPPIDGGSYENLVPNGPQENAPDVEANSKLLNKALPESPTRRFGDYADIVYPRPNYQDKKPYIYTKELHYPPGSMWNQDRTQILYSPLRDYYSIKYPTEPAPREEHVAMAQPLTILRGNAIMMEPTPVAAGAGDDTADLSTAVFNLDTTPSSQPAVSDEEAVTNAQIAASAKPGAPPASPLVVAAAAQQKPAAASTAGANVWDAITSVVKGVAPAFAAGGILSKFGGAYNSALGKLGIKPPSAPTPWYLSPGMLLGAAIVVSGGIYMMTRKGTSGARRGTTRRYRRNVGGRIQVRRRNVAYAA